MVAFRKTETILSLEIDFTRAAKFSDNFFSSKETLPMTEWMIGKSPSVRQDKLEERVFIKSSGCSLIVPVLGFGIKPLGPKIFAIFANFGIIDG